MRPIQSIGRYLLFGEIASGGMATVHLGRVSGAAGFSRTVAIKRLHPAFARDTEFVSMFLDEARLAARIRHPNVIPTLDVVATESEVFLVMEYVQGEALGRLRRVAAMRKHATDPRIVASIMSGVLYGLHAAHEATDEFGHPLGIVHRDVSPQNVLVGADGTARLLDFGVAKAMGRRQTTQIGEVKGKLAYMAPEQLNGLATNRRADVYSAAVVTWEALTGERLFQGEPQSALIASVFEKRVPPPSSVSSHVPRAFDRVVMRGLARNPDHRYATAREMAVELERCAGVASMSEVGSWVESLAGAELRTRASLIAAMESASAATSAVQSWRPGQSQIPAPPESNASNPPWTASQVSRTRPSVVIVPRTRRDAGLFLWGALGAASVVATVVLVAARGTHEVAPHTAVGTAALASTAASTSATPAPIATAAAVPPAPTASVVAREDWEVAPSTQEGPDASAPPSRSHPRVRGRPGKNAHP
jgi:serine/threonine protein kinase